MSEKAIDEITNAIGAEIERINADFEARTGTTQTVFVLAIVSMATVAHEALDEVDNPPEIDSFCREIIDHAFAKVLKERGWTVIHPKGRN